MLENYEYVSGVWAATRPCLTPLEFDVAVKPFLSAVFCVGSWLERFFLRSASSDGDCDLRSYRTPANAGVRLGINPPTFIQDFKGGMTVKSRASRFPLRTIEASRQRKATRLRGKRGSIFIDPSLTVGIRQSKFCLYRIVIDPHLTDQRSPGRTMVSE